MKSTTKRRLVVLVILLGSLALMVALASLKKPLPKKSSGDKTLLVETLTLEPETIQFMIESQGTVKPRVSTTLSAEISGRIVYISDNFVAGGYFEPDEVLMEIDPTDYKVAVEQAQALVKQRQIEYNGALSLRKSGYRAEAELASAEAALAAAKASLTKAEKNLERTQIKLPYKGMIREKVADLGQYVTPGSRLAVTFGIETAEIRLPLTDSDLSFLSLPISGKPNNGADRLMPQVRLTATQKGTQVEWLARISRTEGVVDESSRVTYAVAEVIDPYRTNPSLPDDNQAVLPMGTYVTAHINGIIMQDIIKVPRTSLRSQNELLFVDQDNKLEIRPVDILRSDEQYAYLNAGARPGDRICLTAIESPINGMKLRTTSDPEPVDSEQAEDQTTASEQAKQ